MLTKSASYLLYKNELDIKLNVSVPIIIGRNKKYQPNTR